MDGKNHHRKTKREGQKNAQPAGTKTKERASPSPGRTMKERRELVPLVVGR